MPFSIGIFAAMFMALSLTLVIEFPVFALFFKRTDVYLRDFKSSFKLFVYTNIATNVTLNLLIFILSLFPFFRSMVASAIEVVVLELIVMFIEGFIYYSFFHCGRIRCYIASIVANITSVVLGFLILYGFGRYFI